MRAARPQAMAAAARGAWVAAQGQHRQGDTRAVARGWSGDYGRTMPTRDVVTQSSQTLSYPPQLI
uniref:Uncharacterized protein n=1 Tax=Oryza sativa subsp. japonica TaxID=39947 RepID=Q6YW28_ORYSJ|nr:hypothetical protein [Oryza sativa Japonica Group]BAD05838.1 hypothetical protein [Oryza sativa Japonica Group]